MPLQCLSGISKPAVNAAGAQQRWYPVRLEGTVVPGPPRALGEPLSPRLGGTSLCPLPSSQGKVFCRRVFSHLSQGTFQDTAVPGISLPEPVQCSHGMAAC